LNNERQIDSVEKIDTARSSATSAVQFTAGVWYSGIHAGECVSWLITPRPYIIGIRIH